MRYVLLFAIACSSSRSTVEQIADRGWRATEVIVAAGENAKTCAEAGVAMAAAERANHAALIAAEELQSDREKLRQATDFMAAQEARYRDLETRMEALESRCEAEPSVVAVFDILQDPFGGKPPAGQ